MADLHVHRVDEHTRETRSNPPLCHGHLRVGHFAVAGLVLLAPEVLSHLDLERRPNTVFVNPASSS